MVIGMSNRKKPLITRGRKRKARAMRKGSMPGTNKSHYMTEWDSPEEKKYKYKVTPSVFQNKDSTWIAKQGHAAFAEAHKRGEVFGFKRKKRAEKFGAGSWKKGKDKRVAMKNYRARKKSL